MTPVRRPSTLRRGREPLRWAVCFALALCFHAAGAAALLARWHDSTDLVAAAPVITVELAPVPVAPEVTPAELPPGPQQAESQPESQQIKPIETAELPSAPQAELQVVPPPKPHETQKVERPRDGSSEAGATSSRGR